MEKTCSVSREISCGDESGGYKIKVEVKNASSSEFNEIKKRIDADF